MAAKKTKSTPKIAPIYVIVGKDESLVNLHCRELVDELVEPDQRAMGLFEPEPNQVTITEVLDELRTLPFLTDKRVVLIEQADDFVTAYRTRLEDYFDSPSSTGVLILTVGTWRSNTKLAKKLKKVGQLIDAGTPSAGQLPSRLIQYAADAHSKKLSSETARLLIELAGDELVRLYSEIDKLALYANEKKTITAEHVEALVGHNRLFSAFAVIDAVISGQTAQALQRLRKMFADDRNAEFTVVGAFAYHLRRQFRARVMLDKGVNLRQIRGQLRIFGKTDEFFAQLRKMSLRRIGRYHSELAATDYAIKTGQVHTKVAMEQLVLKLASTS